MGWTKKVTFEQSPEGSKGGESSGYHGVKALFGKDDCGRGSRRSRKALFRGEIFSLKRLN